MQGWKGLTGWLAAATLAGLSGAAEGSMPLEELRRGQKGYGLSVFAGTEPVRFEVEILGVLAHTTPEVSYILARLSGQNLEHSGILSGMSGSPVYIDGELVGAVSFSYLFGLDPIAGITPIAAMRRLREVPAATPPEVVRPAVTLDELRRRDFAPDALARSLEALWPRGSGESRRAIQWSASGFSGDSMEILRAGLGAVAPASGALLVGAPAAGAGELEPGGAVAALLVTGDFSLAAHGTVTERSGEEVLAFGHPLFSLGPAKIPMASSEVVTVIPSRFNSFKVSNAGAVVGAFDQDREAGARGVIGLEAPMIPLRVGLRGLAERDYAMEVVDLPQLTPAMAAISALSALTAGSYSTGPQGIDMEARIALEGYEDLRIRQSFDGDQAGVDSAVYLLSYVSYLMQNTMEKVRIREIDVLLDQVDRPRLAELQAVEADRSEVRPGERVGLVLTLAPYRGEPYRLRTEVEVPEDAPEGSYHLMVGDGTSMDGVRLAVEKREPETLGQSLELLASFGSRRQLRVFGLVAGPGLATAGEVLPLLPGSVRSIFGSGSTPAGTRLRLAVHMQHEEWLDRPFEGVRRIDLNVKNH